MIYYKKKGSFYKVVELGEGFTDPDTGEVLGQDETYIGAIEITETKSKYSIGRVLEGKIERGIAICGSGVGVSIAANKFSGVRATLITENYSAHQGVEHDNMNLMCLGGRVIGSALIWELTETFLNATFHEEERFKRRLNKVLEIEKNNFKEIN